MPEPDNMGIPRKAVIVYLGVSVIVFAIVAAVYFFVVAKNSEDTDDERRPMHVLIVGNDSLHFNDVANMLREVAKSSHSWRPLEVSTLAVGDYSIARHVADESAQEMIKADKWDCVVLQDSWLQPLQDPSAMLDSTRTIAAVARKRGCKTVLLMSWADKGQATQQEVVSAVTRKLAERLDLDVAPAGDTLFAATRLHKELDPYASDNHHLSPIGSWLVAAAVYSTITNQKPLMKPEDFTYHTGYDDKPHVDIDSDLAIDLCTVVWEIVHAENKGRALGAEGMKPVFLRPDQEI